MFLAPPRFTQTPEDGIAEIGKSFTFKLDFNGFPTPEVKWFYGEEEVRNEGRFLIDSTDRQTVLDIADVEMSDKGEYSCKISNEAGEDTCGMTLAVFGKYCYGFEMIAI